MTRHFQLICMVALLAGNVLPASAQTPDRGMFAAGADIGAFFPDDVFENAFAVNVFGEYYVTPRWSGRVMLAVTKPGVEAFTEDHFRQIKLLFNGVYNWELGVWHPFATVGAGAYFVRLLREDRPDPEGETRGGLNLGGGIEYFLNSLTTVKGELRWDVVSHPPGLPDATGVSLTVGLKRYF
jgi:outer membrane protein with beta-barrel domain